MEPMQVPVNTEQEAHLRELVAALRSGDYEQGQGQLRQGDLRCCLGVACDLLPAGRWDEESNYVLPSGTTMFHYLDDEALRHYGFTEQDRSSVVNYHDDSPGSQFRYAKMNDDSCTFAEIADAIEQDFELA